MKNIITIIIIAFSLNISSQKMYSKFSEIVKADTTGEVNYGLTISATTLSEFDFQDGLDSGYTFQGLSVLEFKDQQNSYEVYNTKYHILPNLNEIRLTNSTLGFGANGITYTNNRIEKLIIDQYPLSNNEEFSFINLILDQGLDTLIIRNCTGISGVDLRANSSNFSIKHIEILNNNAISNIRNLEQYATTLESFIFENNIGLGNYPDLENFNNLKYLSFKDSKIEDTVRTSLLNLPNLKHLDLRNNNLYTFHIANKEVSQVSNLRYFNATGQVNTHTGKYINDLKAGDIIDTLPNLISFVSALGYTSNLLFDFVKDTLETGSQVTLLVAKENMVTDEIKTNIVTFNSEIFGEFTTIYGEEDKAINKNHTDYKNNRTKPIQVNKIEITLPESLIADDLPDEGANLLDSGDVLKILPTDFTHKIKNVIWKIVYGAELLTINPDGESNLRVGLKKGKKGYLGVQAYYPFDSSYTKSNIAEIGIGIRPIDSVWVVNTFNLMNFKDTSEKKFVTQYDTVKILEKSKNDYSVILYPTPVLEEDVRKDSLTFTIESSNPEIIEVYDWLNYDRTQDSLVTFRIHAIKEGEATITVKKINEGASALQTTKFIVFAEQKIYTAPNPIPPGADKTLNLFFESTEPRSLIIYDSYGRLVKRKDLEIYEYHPKTDMFLNELDMNDFRSGTYFLKIERSGEYSGYVKTIVIE
jgi:hypothetical protein